MFFHYLGNLIYETGLEPLAEKLNSIQDMPLPRNPKEVNQFLVQAQYYRKFVPRFANISRPLTSLTKKDVPFEWTKTCHSAFNSMKEYLNERLILKHPTLFTDANKYAWACVIIQAYDYVIYSKKVTVFHPITYTSGLFRDSHINLLP